MKLINMAYYSNNPEMYKLIERRDMLRLKGYVENFQSDMEKTQRVYGFRDSLRKGNLNYADSIMLDNPKLAKRIMQFKPVADSLDSISLPTLPNETQISNFLAENEVSKEVLAVSENMFPVSAVGLSLKELIDTTNTTYRW